MNSIGALMEVKFELTSLISTQAPDQDYSTFSIRQNRLRSADVSGLEFEISQSLYVMSG